jgi:EAL domain-containing protein (putative c-di-GMP-specific phosphodiesterase class I)
MLARCSACHSEPEHKIDFTMAFQPIVDVERKAVWGYEALVRGPGGQSAASVLDEVDDTNRYWFDQACRVKAIELAAKLFSPTARLSINFMPNAVYEPRACIRATLEASRKFSFDPKRLMFEFTENEEVSDPSHLEKIVIAYKSMGFLTAIDDFGAGHSGLGLLANFQPDVTKIDMKLVRGIERSPARRAIIRSVKSLADELGMSVLAEGIETAEEYDCLKSFGIRLFQGYYFSRPVTAAVPVVRDLQSV